MKLTKRDIAEGLGLTYLGIEWMYNDSGCEVERHRFLFGGKEILMWPHLDEEQAWEEAAEKLLEPLVDYLLGNLDDES